MSGSKRTDLDSREHRHRRPTCKDFEGKTIAKFRCSADNVWKFWFTDGTAFAIQAESFGPCHVAGMEICEVCIGD